MTTYQKRVPIPEPMREAPKDGDTFWVPDPKDASHPIRLRWFDDWVDIYVPLGIVYRTKKDAIARAKAMLMTEEDK